MPKPRIAVVGATGAVGSVLRSILQERGHDDVRYFASARRRAMRPAPAPDADW